MQDIHLTPPLLLLLLILFTQIKRDLKLYLHATCVLETINGLDTLKQFKNFWLIPNFVNKIV